MAKRGLQLQNMYKHFGYYSMSEPVLGAYASGYIFESFILECYWDTIIKIMFKPIKNMYIII